MKKMNLEDFVDWLETKNPDERYDFSDHSNCCVSQYLKHLGYEDPRCSTGAFSLGVHPFYVEMRCKPGTITLFPGARSHDDGDNAFNRAANNYAETFGEALKIARTYL